MMTMYPKTGRRATAPREPNYQRLLAGTPVIEVFMRLQPAIEKLAPGADLS